MQLGAYSGCLWFEGRFSSDCGCLGSIEELIVIMAASSFKGGIDGGCFKFEEREIECYDKAAWDL